jgi:hypothetical protein
LDAIEIHIFETVELRTLQNGINSLPSQQVAVSMLRVVEVKSDLFEERRG